MISVQNFRSCVNYKQLQSYSPPPLNCLYSEGFYHHGSFGNKNCISMASFKKPHPKLWNTTNFSSAYRKPQQPAQQRKESEEHGSYEGKWDWKYINNIPFDGISIAGKETSIVLPNQDIVLDMGMFLTSAKFQRNLFLSHGHLDHIRHLARYLVERAKQKAGRKHITRVYVPDFLFQKVENLIRAHEAMDNSTLRHELIPMQIGKIIAIDEKLAVKALKAFHRIDSVGYLFYCKGGKLGRPTNEWTPYIAYTGDTTMEFFFYPNNQEVLKVGLLIMETTYMDIEKVKSAIDKDKASEDNSNKEVKQQKITTEMAIERGHVHLDQVVANANIFKNISAILMFHFSLRYNNKEAEDAAIMLSSVTTRKVKALTRGLRSPKVKKGAPSEVEDGAPSEVEDGAPCDVKNV